MLKADPATVEIVARLTDESRRYRAGEETARRTLEANAAHGTIGHLSECLDRITFYRDSSDLTARISAEISLDGAEAWLAWNSAAPRVHSAPPSREARYRSRVCNDIALIFDRIAEELEAIALEEEATA